MLHNGAIFFICQLMSAETQRKLHNIASIGTVIAVDTATQSARFAIGELSTDWLPIPTVAAGAVSVWRCPSIGEQFLLVAPSGDLANAIPTVALFSEHYPAPSDHQGEIVIRFNERDLLSIDTTTGIINLTATTVNLNTDVNITGNLLVSGQIKALQDVLANHISLQKHRHAGVQAGTSATGAAL